MLFGKRLYQSFLFGCTALIIGCGGSDNVNKTQPNSTVVSDGGVYQENPTGEVESSSSQSTSSALPSGSSVALHGRITFDRVLFGERSYRGLDYQKTQILPARAVTVQVVDTQNRVLDETMTDGDGRYRVEVAQNVSVRLRVQAEMTSPTNSVWSVTVQDNTQGNADYVLDGSLASSGVNGSQQRDLHAASGWDGEGYGQVRAAAPFAILDSLYDGYALLDQAMPGSVLPPLYIYWSPSNIAINGNKADGHIGTSYYTSSGPSIYLLGAENNDSDEYDRAVIQHEFGHYIEHQLGRTESLGGGHSQRSRLDMRVAFGEAWGNAFAGMAATDPLYRDSFGGRQELGFTIDVEKQGFHQQGWFSEASLQAIIYDLFDATDDGADTLSLGFAPILRVLTSDEYLSFEGFASIYPFADVLKKQQPAASSAVDALLRNANIYGQGGFGTQETNDGGSPIVLPLYRNMAAGQTLNLCSDSDYQDYNGMDVRRFVRFTIPTSGTYTFTARKTSGGLQRSNPQMKIFRQGQQVASMLSGTADVESGDRYLEPGQYILELYEQANVDNSQTSGLACFDVSIH